MTLNRGLPCQRSHPREFAVRPTLAGDICILLETTLPEEIADLKARQAELQSIYGGVPVPLIHLTCQRFSNLDGAAAQRTLDNLAEEMQKASPTFSPIPLIAVKLVPLFVPFEQQNVLKWCVHVSDDVRSFIEKIRWMLERVDIPSLYQPWFVPTLVTALKDLPSLEKNAENNPALDRLPQHLFTGRRLQLSRVNAPDDYDILASVDW